MKADKLPTQLHADLKPGPRVDTLFLEEVFPALEPLGYTFLKSQPSIRKKQAFFDYITRWNSSKFNEGRVSVDFDLGLYVYAPSFRPWEKKFYQLEKNRRNPISAKALSMIPGWDYTYYEHNWYDVVKNDNIILMEKVRENLLGPGQQYFDQFSELPKALAFLKTEAPTQLEIIIDLETV